MKIALTILLSLAAKIALATSITIDPGPSNVTHCPNEQEDFTASGGCETGTTTFT